MTRRPHATLLAAALATSLLAASPAQAFSLRESWATALSLGAQAVELVAQPIAAATSWTMRQIFAAEHAAAEGARRFAATLRDDLERFETLAGRAGFRLTMVTIKPGIIPEIELAFEPAEEITPDAEAALRADLAQLQGVIGATERAIILLLLDIDETVAGIRPAGFRVGEIGVAVIAILPELTINFVRGETSPARRR